MATSNQANDPAQDSAAQDDALAREQTRARRLGALKAVEGLWKDRTDIPKDGLAYQEEMRAEWRSSCLTPTS